MIMNEQEELIRKWLNRSLSSEEQKRFEQLNDSSFYRKIVEDAKSFRPDPGAVLPEWSVFRDSAHRSRNKRISLNINRYWVAAAAAVVVVLGGIMYSDWKSQDMIRYGTDAGEHRTVALPDGSTALLNAESSISFSQRKWKDKREVNLSGEALFRVEKGVEFSVVTSTGRVGVLGTVFNVKERTSLFEVYCHEGSVRVEVSGYASDTLRARESISLKSNRLIRMDQKSSGLPWTSERSVFYETPLREVFSELSRQFGLEVHVAEGVDQEVLFSGAFSNRDLRLALRTIVDPMGLKYENTGQGVIHILP